MPKTKYPISNEFFPFNKFAPPMSVGFVKLAQEAGIEAELHESKGTVHGFDTVFNAPTTQKMIALRVEYLKRMFDQ